MIKKTEPKKGKSKRDEKSKGTKKEGIMEFVVCITANPFSTEGRSVPFIPGSLLWKDPGELHSSLFQRDEP